MHLGLDIGLGGPLDIIVAPWLIPGSSAWFETDVGVTVSGSDITSWKDTLTGGTHIVTPPTASPTLVASVYNGHPTARFVAASSQFLSAASTNLLGNGAYSIVCTFKPTASADGIVGNWTASGGAGLRVNGGNRQVLHPGAVAHDDAAIGTALQTVFITRASGAKPKLYLNGTEQTLNDASTAMVDGGASNVLAIGHWRGVNLYDGDLCAVGFFSSALGSDLRTSVELYLKNKYGTP